MTPEERDGYRQQFESEKACPHCGGLHLRACGRVKRIVFRRSDEVGEVEFWPDGKWDTSHVVWPEDAYEEDDDGEETIEASAEDAPPL